MARADLLTDLVRFGMSGDKTKFRKVVEAILAEERAKKHTVLAKSVVKNCFVPVPTDGLTPNSGAVVGQKASNLLMEVIPERSLDELILPQEIREISTVVMTQSLRQCESSTFQFVHGSKPIGASVGLA